MAFTSKKPIKILKDPDYLLSYAAWYYGRYAPPLTKLREKIAAKAATPELAASVFEMFERYADDRTNLEAKIAAAATNGKPISKAKNALIMKGFDKEEVRSVISGEPAFYDWETREPAIRKRLQSFVSKGRSQAAILSALRMEYPEFRDELPEYVRENAPDDRTVLSDYHELPGTVPKDSVQKKKLQDKLLRLGFRYAELSLFFEGRD